MDDLGIAQAVPDQFDMSLWRCDPARRLLLERMQHVKNAFKSRQVDSAIGVAVKIVPDFKDTGETLQRLCIARVLAQLSLEQRLSDLATYL